MIIYLATNKINGLKYIGQTTKNLDKRIKGHIQSAMAGSKIYFHRALKKYGIESFEWEIIAETSSKEKLNELEIFYIKEYNTFSNSGYNSTNGGRGLRGTSGWKHTEESKKKISENSAKINLGKKLSEETRRKIGEAQTGKTWAERCGEGKALKMKSNAKRSYIEKYGKERAEQIKKKQSKSNKSSSDEFKKKMRLSMKGRLDENGKRKDITDMGRKNMSISKMKEGNPNYVHMNDEITLNIINEYINNNNKITKEMCKKLSLTIYLIRRVLKEKNIYERKRSL